MQIFIKTLTGRKQQLNFENESTVLEVKQALQEKEGIQVDQIRWVVWLNRETAYSTGRLTSCFYNLMMTDLSIAASSFQTRKRCKSITLLRAAPSTWFCNWEEDEDLPAFTSVYLYL